MLKLNQFLAGLVTVFVLGICLDATAQSSSVSNIFIPEQAFVSIFGEHSFIKGGTGVNPGMISTAKNGSHGYVNFAKGSSWSGASDVQFIDGYVRVYHDDPFVFPIGDNGKFRPVSINGAALTSAAYFDRNPAKVVKGTANRAGDVKGQIVVERVSDVEYWEIEGQKATNVTFTWGKDSKVGELTQEDLSKLSIVGWKRGQWKVLSSTFDTYTVGNASHVATSSINKSTLATGSISTTEEVIPSDYDYFTLAGINSAAIAGQTAFSMFPNPRLATMPLNVRYELPTADGGILRIFSANGSVLVERDLTSNTGVLTFSDVTTAPGAYNVSVTDSNGNTLSKKLIVVTE